MIFSGRAAVAGWKRTFQACDSEQESSESGGCKRKRQDMIKKSILCILLFSMINSAWSGDIEIVAFKTAISDAGPELNFIVKNNSHKKERLYFYPIRIIQNMSAILSLEIRQ